MSECGWLWNNARGLGVWPLSSEALNANPQDPRYRLRTGRTRSRFNSQRLLTQAPRSETSPYSRAHTSRMPARLTMDVSCWRTDWAQQTSTESPIRICCIHIYCASAAINTPALYKISRSQQLTLGYPGALQPSAQPQDLLASQQQQPWMGLLFSLGFEPTLARIGGDLAATAAMAVFAVLGLRRLLPGRPS
jgi:hypothetical protein